jgi:hypothetical protein
MQLIKAHWFLSGYRGYENVKQSYKWGNAIVYFLAVDAAFLPNYGKSDKQSDLLHVRFAYFAAMISLFYILA